jgi:hypothetical protein
LTSLPARVRAENATKQTLSYPVTCRSRAARDAHPLHACLPVLVETAGQPQSDATVAALAARCASCVAVLDPVAAAGAAAHA